MALAVGLFSASRKATGSSFPAYFYATFSNFKPKRFDSTALPAMMALSEAIKAHAGIRDTVTFVGQEIRFK